MSGNEIHPPAENRLLLPFSLLALSVAILICAMLLNTVRQRAALKADILQTQIQGQKAVEVRLHYYNLYKDLFVLSSKNSDAEKIVRKYGIQFTEPTAEIDGAVP